MSRLRMAPSVLLPLLGAAALAACGPPAAAPVASGEPQGAGPAGAIAAPASPAVEALKVAASTGIATAPYVVAQARGYYTEAGLDVSFLEMPSATGVKAAVAGEFALVNGGSATITAALNEAPVRVVFVAAARPLFWLYGLPSIGTLRELRGQRVGISSRGDGAEMIARLVLGRAGLDPDGDLTWVVLGSGTARYQALLAGSVEAAVLSSPSDVLARRAGFRELSSFSRELEAGSSAGTGAPLDFLRQRPETARRWLEATIKGLRYFKAERAESVRIMAPPLGLDGELTAEVYDAVVDSFGTDGTMEEAGMRLEIDLNKQALGLEDKHIAPDQVFDFTLTHEALREVQRSGWRP